MEGGRLQVDGLSYRHRIATPRLSNPWATRLGPGVHNISFSLPSGSIVGLVGPNGAGKTTLLHLMCGLRPADSGRMRFDDNEWKDLKNEHAARKNIGFMPDNVRWQGTSTPAKILHRLSLMREAKVGGLIELVGLKSRSKETLDSLSAGMRQRLSLAAAMIGSPGILLLDEPFTGLDPVAQKALQKLLLQLSERGTTIIVSSHLLLELEAIVDRVVLLHQGQVIIDGELDVVRKKLGLDRRLLIEGSKGEPNELLSKFGELIEYSSGDGWSATLERDDGWSIEMREELVRRLHEAGMTPFRIEARLADLAEMLSAATGEDDISLTVAEAMMVPLQRKGVEEE